MALLNSRPSFFNIEERMRPEGEPRDERRCAYTTRINRDYERFGGNYAHNDFDRH